MSKEAKKANLAPIKSKPVAIDAPPQKTLPMAAVQASMQNDWSGVAWPERIMFVRQLCDNLNVPLALNPFKFIPMKKKVNQQWKTVSVLYAPSEAFSLISRKNRVSTEIRDKRTDEEHQMFIVSGRAQDPEGNFTDEEAEIYVGGLSEQDLANARMKCVTKFKRRAVKSLIGMSILDADDLEAMKKRGEIDSAPISIPAESSTESNEDEEAQDRVFQSLAEKVGPEAANTISVEKTGKQISQLNAQEVADLEAAIEDDPELITGETPTEGHPPSPPSENKEELPLPSDTKATNEMREDLERSFVEYLKKSKVSDPKKIFKETVRKAVGKDVSALTVGDCEKVRELLPHVD